MRIGLTAHQVNEQLRALQDEWYKKLLRTETDYNFQDYANFSSPFCFGVSKFAWSNEKPLLMYIGEEPKDWWFNDENHHEQDIKYLQEYSVAYLEKQLYSASNIEKYQCVKEYPHVFEKQNHSPFWAFIRDIYMENDSIKYNVCWNNLDKLHRIVKSKTKPLTYKMEEKLHSILISQKSLFLNEIDLVKPDIIIFMGKYYDQSMAWAMGKNYSIEELNKYKPSSQTFFVSEFSDIPTPLQNKVKKMIWIYHPNYIQHQGAENYTIAKTQVEKILKSV